MKSKMKLLCILIYFVSNLSVFAQKRFQSEIFTSTDSLTNIQYGQHGIKYRKQIHKKMYIVDQILTFFT